MNTAITVEAGELPVHPVRLRQAALDVLRQFGREAAEVSLLVVDDARMHELNKTYRSVDRPTDVLAFEQTAGPVVEEEPELLGDIVISSDTAQRDAEEDGEPYPRHFVRLFVHGLLHLLGYDHYGSDEDEWNRVEPAALQAAFVAAGVEDAP